VKSVRGTVDKIAKRLAGAQKPRACTLGQVSVTRGINGSRYEECILDESAIRTLLERHWAFASDEKPDDTVSIVKPE
jgi:hypothetical protein